MAIATAAVGVTVAAVKFFEGRAKQKKAERFIENFEWQDLTNPYETEQVSTLGSDFMQEQANIGASAATAALRTGGSRSIVGGLGRIETERSKVNRQVATNLDEQQKAINTRMAQQEVANQAIIEKRQADELAGYGQLMNVGMGLKYQGMTDMVNAAGAAASAYGGGGGGGDTSGGGGGTDFGSFGSSNMSSGGGASSFGGGGTMDA